MKCEKCGQKLPPKRGPGKPRKELTAEDVERLAAWGCTQAEIGAMLGMSKATVTRRFNENSELVDAYERGHLKGNSSLRRAQFKSAVKNGNTQMLQWLGMDRLGQSSRAKDEVRHTHSVGEVTIWQALGVYPHQLTEGQLSELETLFLKVQEVVQPAMLEGKKEVIDV